MADRCYVGGRGELARWERALNAIEIRTARPAEAPAIAQMHIAAWRETYADMMPAAALAALDLDEWTRKWRANFAEGANDAAQAVFVVEDGEGIAGFAFCRRLRSEKLVPLGYEGEITSVYLLRRAQQRGIGRRLLRLMATHLDGAGCKSAAVWMFRDAPHARRFYEAHGATPTGVEGVWEICGLVLPDVAYGWRDLLRSLDGRIEQE